MTRRERLFDQYVEELRDAKAFAELWWAKLESLERSKPGTQQDVDKRLKRRWPAGPAAHPVVLATVRKYWLACEELNEQIPTGKYSRESEPEYRLNPKMEPGEAPEEPEPEKEEEVYPHVFVLEWLMDGEHDDLARFLGSLTYWPVGIDKDGRYT